MKRCTKQDLIEKTESMIEVIKNTKGLLKGRLEDDKILEQMQSLLRGYLHDIKLIMKEIKND